MVKYFNLNEAPYNVRCKLYCNDPRNIQQLIVYFHGFGGHKETKAAERFAEKLLSKKKRAAVLTFDLPCHGEDGRKNLLLDDCDAYIRIILSHYAVYDLYAYATSFGGYLVLKYIHEHGNPFRKIVLRCPAVNMPEALRQKIMTEDDRKEIDSGKPVEAGFDRKVKISPCFEEELKNNDIRCWSYLDYADDIIIYHGSKDEVIAYDAVKEFAENNVIDFETVLNADHRFIDPQIMDLTIARILEYIK